jgi:MerR family transcriptional regulator, light-induced transcriptional regulator
MRLALTQSKDSQRDTAVYNIKAVSRLTGIPADTLRRWESRYQVISPRRTEGGYRLYSQRDVDTIHWLKGKLDDGLSISRACEMLRHMGGAPVPAAPASSARAASRPTGDEPAVESFEALRESLLDAFRAVDEERAGAALTEALGLYSVEEVCLRILQPALVQVGEGWLEGEIPVATEHFASAFVRNRLSNLFHSSHYNAHGPLVLVACAPGEFHELGPLFLAVFLRRGGFRVVYLGQNVPLESLEGMIESMQPDAVCVSASRAETAARLYVLSDWLEKLRATQGRAPLLAYGGRVFDKYPHITERLGGTYLGENAGIAVERLREELGEE